ncbi:HigA family addiction module antitoxin [Pusillimonas sp. ANT_WB101]|uniref:HigA family addiction module antitoxin n=1 Tax=Pusillimonas sp. ANT_WB101 TaxID=2597356 RepID=UPI0011F0057F|nr:HigA family addiction module antitoxin [Pusillimonas sp. ANT_WB101]KAA0889365.1 HigA family addiction module antidote protein [Pusillimonas sp. ANT_WB101]
MIKNGMRPIHPGEVLREEYLAPLGISVNALSKYLHVPATRMNEIVRERRGITPDTALRLAAFFDGDANSWLNLQQAYDLKSVDKQVVQRILKEIQPLEHV